MEKLDTIGPYGLVGMAFVAILCLPVIGVMLWCVAKRGGKVRIWPILTFEIPSSSEATIPAVAKSKKRHRN